jgi:tryptophan synthase alpha chain
MSPTYFGTESDLLELGVPFSDPVADGPTIQRASHEALHAGMTPSRCLGMVRALREEGMGRPLLLMGYYNPILNWGVEAYVHDCRAAGVDGLIVPDLPPEEAGDLQAACQHEGLALVFLVAPTTPDARLGLIAGATSGFLYVVSRLSTTGAGQGQQVEVSEAMRARLALVRWWAHTPVALGFGIATPAQVRALAPEADGLVVGSAIVERASQGPEALRGFVASLRAALV